MSYSIELVLEAVDLDEIGVGELLQRRDEGFGEH